MKELLSSLTGVMFIVLIALAIAPSEKKNSEKMRNICLALTIALLCISSEYDRIAPAVNNLLSLLIPVVAGIVVTIILVIIIYRLIRGRRIK